MADEIPQEFLSSDKPLTNPTHDRLGYRDFAKHLADSICKVIDPEGLVVSLYGPWGSGKSTLIEFVVHFIKQKPNEEQPIIVRFNPWWFSGREDLVRRLLEQLGFELQEKWKTKVQDTTQDIVDFVKRLSDVVAEVPLPGSGLPKKITEQFPNLYENDLGKIKAKIGTALKKHQQKILIIVDDIDRLTGEEIRQLFGAIKAIVDLPNIVYLLAFDKQVVVKALEEVQGIPGESYLEKIVQVPLNVPDPDKVSLSSLLLEDLDKVVIANNLFDQDYWSKVYHSGLRDFFKTPRDVKRFINSLRLTYPNVKDEVNPVDFIAIEAIRVFVPQVYEIIRNNAQGFVGEFITSSNPQYEGFKQFHQSWISKVPEQFVHPVNQLTRLIFPILQSVNSKSPIFGVGNRYVQWRKQFRICTDEAFDTYFRLVISQSNISNSEMNDILNSVKDSGQFAAKLLQLAQQNTADGTTRVRAFLARLEDYVEKDIPNEYIPAVITAFFKVADRIDNPEDQTSFLDFGNKSKIGRIVFLLLGRLDHELRFGTIKACIERSDSISFIVDFIYYLGDQHGKHGSDRMLPEQNRDVNSDELQELEVMTLEKIKEFASGGNLLNLKDFVRVLDLWVELSSSEEVREWVDNEIVENLPMFQFIVKFFSQRYYTSGSAQKMSYSLNPKSLEPYLEVDRLVERLTQIDQNSINAIAQKMNLPAEQLQAITTFVEEYQKSKLTPKQNG